MKRRLSKSVTSRVSRCLSTPPPPKQIASKPKPKPKAEATRAPPVPRDDGSRRTVFWTRRLEDVFDLQMSMLEHADDVVMTSETVDTPLRR